MVGDVAGPPPSGGAGPQAVRRRGAAVPADRAAASGVRACLPAADGAGGGGGPGPRRRVDVAAPRVSPDRRPEPLAGVQWVLRDRAVGALRPVRRVPRRRISPLTTE